MKVLKRQQMATSIIPQGFEDHYKDMGHYSENPTKSPQKYLRFWGIDYMYLSENKSREPKWLPIPENSEAQRMIRDLNRKLQL